MYPEYILKLAKKCEIDEEELEILTKDELFKRLLEYEGIIHYTNYIKNLVENIYNVKLNN